MNTSKNENLTATNRESTYVADVSAIGAEYKRARADLAAGNESSAANLTVEDLRGDLLEIFTELLIDAGCDERAAGAAAAILT